MQRRVIQEFVGNSELDDGIIKHLLREYIGRIQILLKEEDLNMVRHHQGYIAALDESIRLMRQSVKQSIIKANDINED